MKKTGDASARRVLLGAVVAACIGSPLGCSSESAGGSGGSSQVGEPCASGSECAGDLLCQKDGDGTFVCTEDPNATTTTGGTTGDTTGGATGGTSSTGDAGTTTGGATGVDLNDCALPAPTGATCNPYCNLGCTGEQYCTWTGGGFGCVAGGANGIGAACNQQANDCEAGMACINIGDGPVCRQFCTADGECPDGRLCNSGINFPGGASAQTCSDPTTGCDPFDQSSCAEGQGCYLSNNVTKCMEAGELAGGELCNAAGDNACTPGLQCLIACTEICATEAGVGDAAVCADTCGGSEKFNTANAENKVGFCITDTPPAECDLYTQTGCGAGQGCYLTNAGFSCINAGSIAEGEACQFTNDCEPSTLCVNQRCQSACSAKEGSDPAIACAEICAAFQQITPAEWGIGFCSASSTCDFWAQDCEDVAETCYVTGSGSVCMMPGANTEAGGACQQANGCDGGLMCVQNVCTEICSINELQPNATICIDDCPGGTFDPVSVEAQIGVCAPGG
ncbi:MAG: hypothetical protein ACI9WU_002914 [Myxococcota bacterium]|jgi:hypothetical protein